MVFFYLFLEGSLTAVSNGHSRGSISHRPGNGNNECHHEQQRLQPANSTEQEHDPPSAKKKGKGISFCRTSAQLNQFSRRLAQPRASSVTMHNELTPVPSSSSSNHRQTISQRTTKMLVICSTTFLVLNSPYCAVLLYSIITKDVLTRVLDILRHFYFMSFCLNFFLYSLCGHRFRQELILLLKRLAKKCCSKGIYSQFTRLEKIPANHSFTRTPARTAV